MRRARPSIAALALYLAVTLLVFGVPILAHPERELLGTGTDPDLFVWMLGWWPHAILHGENPIVTHAIWSPAGVDLAWTTSVPALSLLATPLTLAFGPALSYNLLSLVAPALDAFTAYLLCRHLTRRFWPSLAGGYLFGFSAYVLGQLEGHLHMTSVFLVPLLALVVLRRLEGSLSRRRFVLLLGVLLAFQFAISTEIWFTTSLALAVSLAAAFALLPDLRCRAPALAIELVGAYVLWAILVSPLLVYALAHFQHGSINEPALFPADLLNVVVPTRLTWLHMHWTLRVSSHYRGNDAENGAYLGLPLLAVVVWFAYTARRRRTTWLLVGLLLLGVFLELGNALHVEGHKVVTLPWAYVAELPGFDNVLPARFAMFVVLAASVIAALWAARPDVPRLARIGLIAAAIAFVVPQVWSSAWHRDPERPSFFTAGLYRACLPPGSTVLMLPWPSHDDQMLWQAEAGYSFRMANGYVSPLVPPGVKDQALFRQFESGWLPPDAGPVRLAAAAQDAPIVAVDATWLTWTPLFAGHEAEYGEIDLVNVNPQGGSPCVQPG